MSENQKESHTTMFRGALIPSLIVGALSILISSYVNGSSGFWGSVLALFIVVIFFSISILVAKVTKSADPISTMALAMFSYFTKLLVIAGFLIAVTRLTDENTVDRRSFGISALAISFAWLIGEVRAFFALRLQLPLPKREK